MIGSGSSRAERNCCCCWRWRRWSREFIRTLKARLQTRRGPGIFQPYRDLGKLFRKGMVIPETASWIFAATPWIVVLQHSSGGTDDSHGCRRGAARLVRRRAGGDLPAWAGPFLSGAERTRYRQLLRRPGQQPRNDHLGAGRTGHDAGHLHRRHRRGLDQPERDRQAPPLDKTGAFLLPRRCSPSPRWRWC